MNEQIWTIRQMLEWTTDYFEKKDLESPRLLIEHALSHVLKLNNRLDLYLQFDRPLANVELDEIRPLVKRLAKGEPLQYVLGNQPFFGLEIKTDVRALIPRPETEELVEWIIEFINDHDGITRLLDIGTGTGCIPLALKNNFEELQCTGCDISEEALVLARVNAQNLDLTCNFERYDFNSPTPTHWLNSFDIVVSNPPYISPKETTVDKHVHLWEPHLALYTDNVPETYLQVATKAHQMLNQKGALFFELNPVYSDQIASGIEALFNTVEIKNDLSGKSRFLKAYGPQK
jgi:release factor glutamine methyltransferase